MHTYTHTPSSLLLFPIDMPQYLTCIVMDFSQNIPRARMCLVNADGSQTAVWPMGDIHTFMNKWIHMPGDAVSCGCGEALSWHTQRFSSVSSREQASKHSHWRCAFDTVNCHHKTLYHPLFCGSNILQAKPYPSLLIQANTDEFPRVRVHIPLVSLEPWYLAPAWLTGGKFLQF